MDPKWRLYFSFPRAGLSFSRPFFPRVLIFHVGVKSSDTGELPRVFGAWDLWPRRFCLGLFNLSCGLSWLMMTAGPQVAVLLSVSSEVKTSVPDMPTVAFKQNHTVPLFCSLWLKGTIIR